MKNGHILSDFHQHVLDAVVPCPVGQDWQLVSIHLSVFLIHKRQVDARYELGRWWNIRVILPASDLQAVNTIFMHCLQVGMRKSMAML